MTQVSYEIRPFGFDRALMKFDQESAAVQWAERRNSNPQQSPVRLVEIVTQVTEREIPVSV